MYGGLSNTGMLMSLAEARTNFHAPGACDERCIPFVRAPLPDEHPTV